MILSAALLPLSQYNQFVNWDYFAVAGKDKPTKISVNSYGQKIKAQDPANWLSLDAAIATGRPVGFVLTPEDPFFFYDLDDCATPEGQWNAVALDAIQRFSGAAMETSVSGRGLHIIGTCGDIGNHARVFPHMGASVELYTSNRFMAFGDQSTATGNALTDCTEVLRSFVPLRQHVEATDWTTEAVPEWTGPEDDDELIRRMLASRPSAAAAFGSTATVRELWEGDEDALARAFPAVKDDEPFNHSSADMALLTHLAFWTGKNCERMDRLFRRSALMRGKYEDRPEYGSTSILKANGIARGVYQGPGDSVAPSAPLAAPSNAVVSMGQYRNTSEWMNIPAQLEYFKGCVYIRDQHRILVPDGGILKSPQFKAMYGGYIFAMNDGTEKPSTNAFEVFTEHRAVSYPSAHTAAFRPDLPPLSTFYEESLVKVNTYVPITVDRVEGDPGPFLRHVETLLPDPMDRAIVLAYMAAVVQYPGIKFQWCPVIQGAEGNGKTFLFKAVEGAVGTRYTHYPKASEIGSKFNSWITGNLFVGIEEIHTKDKQDVMDALKPLITNDRIAVEPKGEDQYTGDNRANLMAATNYKDAVQKDKNDRRYAIFYSAQQSKDDIIRDGMGGRYFPDLYAWFYGGGKAILAQYLATYQIPDELNPAGLLHRAPVTTATEEAIEISLPRAEQGVLEAIEDGGPGFAGGWISSIAFAKLVQEELRINTLSVHRRKEILEGLGYIWHPALERGRSTLRIMQEGGKRPVLFVKRGSIQCNIEDPGQASAAYMNAQGYGNLATPTAQGGQQNG